MLRTMGEPLVRKRAPRSAYEAKFSEPYTVASALIGGTGLGLGINDFTDLLVHEPRRVALMQHITVVALRRRIPRSSAGGLNRRYDGRRSASRSGDGKPRRS
jgi:hypothetical protein